MRKFGLIGYPLGHSFSQRYFTERFLNEAISDCLYELYPLERIEDLPKLLAANPLLEGLNVTVPYKEAVLPYLDAIDPLAARVGAVNTIRIRPGEGLCGYNTDVQGFRYALERFLKRCGREVDAALILGSGGASKAVAVALKDLGISCKVVSRTPAETQLSYEQLHTETWLESHLLLIQATPLGMHPDTNSCPDLPWEKIDVRHLAFDLVYNPEKSVFLANSEARGACIENGLAMLYAQADLAWEIWNA